MLRHFIKYSENACLWFWLIQRITNLPIHFQGECLRTQRKVSWAAGLVQLCPREQKSWLHTSSCSCPNLQSFQQLHFASPMPPLLLPGDLILTHLQTGENPVFRTIWLPSPVWRAVLITGAHIPTMRCVHFRTKSESILIFQTTLAALTDCLVFKSTQSMFYWSSAQQEC